jgi:hypothetical protein
MVYVGGGWAGNGLRFATEEEARASACDLFSRWTLCEDYRADQSDDEVNYVWDNGLKEVSNA